jgi:hypothetical protein
MVDSCQFTMSVRAGAPGQEIVEVVVGDVVTGFGVDAAQPDHERLAAVASGVQDAVIETLRVGVPECPMHPRAHPLDPRVIDNDAWWVCPATSQPVRKIGELKSHAR